MYVYTMEITDSTFSSRVEFPGSTEAVRFDSKHPYPLNHLSPLQENQKWTKVSLIFSLIPIFMDFNVGIDIQAKHNIG